MDTRKYTHGISVITAVKNRISNFKNSFKNWLQNKDIDQIVVVDWDSDDGLFEFVDKIDDARVTFVRIENQPFWCLTKAFNLASRFVKYDKIAKIDADVSISTDFFKKFKLKDGVFFAGNYEIANDENEMNLNGLVYLNTSDYFKVNGYNEHIETYGWDDSDFYNRLTQIAKLERNDIVNQFDRRYAIHQPHGDRLKYHPQKYCDMNNLEIELCHMQEIRKNEKISDFKSWGIDSNMMEIDVVWDDKTNIYKVSEIVNNSKRKPHIPLASMKYSSEGKNKSSTKLKWVEHFTKELEHSWNLHGAWEYDVKNFVIPNSFDKKRANKEFLVEKNQRENYLKKIEERIKSIWNSINEENNNIRYIVPKKINFTELPNRNKNIKLIVQYYIEQNETRKKEIDFAFQKKINNEHIDSIHVLFEDKKSYNNFSFASSKINKSNINKRLSFENCFEYANNNFNEKDVVVVCNLDCFFNHSISRLKKINFENKLVSITRKDLTKEQKLSRPMNPEVEADAYEFNTLQEIKSNRFLDYDSCDAWAFAPNIKKFPSDILLGTYSSEYFLHTSAINHGIKVRNVAEYIDCIHVHNSNYREKFAINNDLSILPNQMYYDRNSEIAINGTWRLRRPENYIDKNQINHEYTDYVVQDFTEVCE
jgi:hypothetical protein